VKKLTGGGKAGRGWRIFGKTVLSILVVLLLLAGCFGLGFPAEAAGPQTRGARLAFFREGELYDLPGYGEEYPVSSVETTTATPERVVRYLEVAGSEPRALQVADNVEVRLCWEEQVCTRFLFWKSCSWEQRQQTLIFPRVPHSSPEDREFGPRQADSRPPSDGEHVVQERETLWGIALRYNINVWDLALINGLEHPYTIYPGGVIKLY